MTGSQGLGWAIVALGIVITVVGLVIALGGRIPILGHLFKRTEKAKRKTNLVIMLTPYIVKDQLELQAIRERKVREHEEFMRSFHTLAAMPYAPRIDYRRKRGLLEEINRTLRSIDADTIELRSLGSSRRVPDGPVNYSVPSDLTDGPIDSPSSSATDGKNPDEDPDAKIDVKVDATLKAAPKPSSPDKPVAPATPAPKRAAPLTPNAKPAAKPPAPAGTVAPAPAAGGSR
jgi:general secretion pathway protein D